MVTIGSACVLAPEKWRWLRALAWLVFLCVLIVLTYNAVARGMQLVLPMGGTPAGKLVAAILGCIALIAAYWAAIRLGERRAVVELNLLRAPSELLLGLGIGSGLLATIVGLLWLFGWVSIEPGIVDRVAIALRDSIRSGVLEELVLRLVFFRLLWRAFGIWPAIIATAMLFGALHLANPDSSLWAAACLIAGEGIGIGLYLLTGHIWTPIGMHAGWNFAQGWIFCAAVSGTTEIAGGPLITTPVAGVPELLSGGGFGPEASLAALVVSLIASAVLLFRAWKLGLFVAADE